MATPLTPVCTSDTVPDFTHCEFYSHVEARAIPLYGEWMAQAGFVNGMPVKIRVMKDCIVIIPQNTRELWGCLEGMSAYLYQPAKSKNMVENLSGSAE